MRCSPGADGVLVWEEEQLVWVCEKLQNVPYQGVNIFIDCARDNFVALTSLAYLLGILEEGFAYLV